jgi:hypothetical protein
MKFMCQRRFSRRDRQVLVFFDDLPLPGCGADPVKSSFLNETFKDVNETFKESRAAD